MSKELFLKMREEEIYAPSFTKKSATLTGKRLVDELLENGDYEPIRVWTKLCRLKEIINSADAQFREKISILEKTKIDGVEFTQVNGGETLNYEEDEVYCELKKDLENRVNLLKLAQKQCVIDHYGNEVMKVSTTPRKSSITIKF